MKIPAFQFYPSDWRSDNGVQALNFYERGIWFEMLCLMHESEQRGKLLLNGKAMPEEALARLLGLDKQAFSKTLTTLLDFGVCSRDESGVIFNRRMVKDEHERQLNAKRQRDFYEKKHSPEKPNGKPNGNLTAIQQKPNKPSSSSSSSSLKEISTNVDTKKAATAKVSDADWIASLKLAKAYRHIDIEAELEKAQIWCVNNNRQRTRKFFVNWLNRILPPVATAQKKDGLTKTLEEMRQERENTVINIPPPRKTQNA